MRINWTWPTVAFKIKEAEMDKDTKIHTHTLLEAGNQTGIRQRLERTSLYSKHSGHCEISGLTHTQTLSQRRWGDII